MCIHLFGLIDDCLSSDDAKGKYWNGNRSMEKNVEVEK